MIVTGLGAADGDGCGAPQAPVAGEAMYRYRVSDEGGLIRVKDLVGGCVLDARLEDATVIADGSACLLGEQTPLRQLGVIRRTYPVFRLSRRDKTVRTRAITVATTMSGQHRSCTVTEERIVGIR